MCIRDRGAPIALLQSEFGAASCDCPPGPPVKCSPLAARLAAEAGLNAGTLRGTDVYKRQEHEQIRNGTGTWQAGGKVIKEASG